MMAIESLVIHNLDEDHVQFLVNGVEVYSSSREEDGSTAQDCMIDLFAAVGNAGDCKVTTTYGY